MANHFNAPDLCSQIEVSGPGFLNLLLSNTFLAQQLQPLIQDHRLGLAKISSTSPIIVEYGSPNVAKEMHVGHLRSAVIGDAIARTLDYLGHQVIRQNHIGDWGTQFGMLIEYLLETNWDLTKEHTISEANIAYKQAKQRFDADPRFANQAREKVVALQSGDPTVLKIWQRLVNESKKHFQEVYQRLGVLLHEEDIRGESFYNPMLPDIVKELLSAGIATHDQGAVTVFLSGFVDRDNQPLPFIIQKSDGGYLYGTTDLAAAKFRAQQLKAKRIIYVVDARQAQHFGMLFATIKKTAWADEDVIFEHAAFGTVLGTDRKPFKTRSGESIQLTSLLDEAEKRARDVVDEKSTLSEDQKAAIAKIVGIGALKYADLSTDKVKDYVFDWDRMLSFEGNTAPYLQNAYVRIQAIFRKGDIQRADLTNQSITVNDPHERKLALVLLEFSDIVHQVADELAPHRLCTYLFELAATFHKFYEACPVLTTADEATRNSRLLFCELTARTLQLGLSLLGIGVLERM